MKVVFLGTNGWYDSPTGNTISILLETDGAYILLDAGNGLYKADHYIGKEKPVFLFLSHLHLDHIIGLHILNKFNFSQGLNIVVQQGMKDALLHLFNYPYSLPFSNLAYPVEVIEIKDFYKTPTFSVETAEMHHAAPTIGFRFSIDGKIITYCPDTGYCDNAVKLAKDALLLIAECAFRPGEESEYWPHLNPETAARLAHNASAKHLALVHFDAYRYPDFESRQQAEIIAQAVFHDTVATRDNQVIEL